MGYSREHDSAFWTERFGSADGVEHWHFYAYEYLDDLAFMPSAKETLSGWPEAGAVIEKVRQGFRRLGWEGDGEIQVLWLPPFVGAGPHDYFGCYALHVKQQNDGISWLASPYILPFHRLFQPDDSKCPEPGTSSWQGTKWRKGAVRWLSDYAEEDTDT